MQRAGVLSRILDGDADADGRSSGDVVQSIFGFLEQFAEDSLEWTLDIECAKCLVKHYLIKYIEKGCQISDCNDGHLVSMVFHILRFFASTISRYSGSERETLSSYGLAVSTVGLLKAESQLGPSRSKDNSYHVFKVQLVKIIANLTHDCSDVVLEEMKLLGVLPLLLNQCRHIDDGNPFIREWSVFAIRNLQCRSDQ